MAELRQLITEHGLAHGDCIEKSELRARALDALASAESSKLSKKHSEKDVELMKQKLKELLKNQKQCANRSMAPNSSRRKPPVETLRSCLAAKVTFVLLLAGILLGLIHMITRSTAASTASPNSTGLAPPLLPPPPPLHMLKGTAPPPLASTVSTAPASVPSSKGLDFAASTLQLVMATLSFAALATSLTSTCGRSGGPGGKHQPVPPPDDDDEDHLTVTVADAESSITRDTAMDSAAG